MPNDFKSTVSSAISDKNFFISSAISGLRTCLVLAVINCADDISIVLSFGDTNDERIEEAVDELQERRLQE